jgi:hypothetical protein
MAGIITAGARAAYRNVVAHREDGIPGVSQIEKKNLAIPQNFG